MTSSDKHTGWVFNRHSECVQRTSEQADKLQLGTLHCQISMKWKQWCQASKQPGCISKKLCFCREPWFWAGLLGFGTTVHCSYSASSFQAGSMIFVLHFTAQYRQSKHNILFSHLHELLMLTLCLDDTGMNAVYITRKCILLMHYIPHRKAHKFLITHDLFQKRFQQLHPAVQHHYRFIRPPWHCNSYQTWGKCSE